MPPRKVPPAGARRRSDTALTALRRHAWLAVLFRRPRD
eukprot:gene10054-45463_t